MAELPRMPRSIYVAFRLGEMAVSLVSRGYNATVLYLLTGEGSTHQTTSARCHIDRNLPKHRAFINFIFAWQRPLMGIDDHCEWAFWRGVDEARKTLKRAGL